MTAALKTVLVDASTFAANAMVDRFIKALAAGGSEG